MKTPLYRDIRTVLLSSSVWIAALGYYVDLYDLVLFGVVRVASLRDLGLGIEEQASFGKLLLNFQMAGMLFGGLCVGRAADRYGRMKTLYVSILIYSLANLANAFVTNIPAYAVCRLIAGIGLAAEFGIAVTLVSEVLPKHVRGIGSSVIGLAGFLGAMTSVLTSQLMNWRGSYAVGGMLGLLLLVTRVKAAESSLFLQTKAKISRGFFAIWTRTALSRLVRCVLVGAPIWFVSGLLLYFAPEFGRALGIAEPVQAGQAILWCYVGSMLGDVSCGILSQLLQSRRRAIALFLGLSLLLVLGFEAALEGSTKTTFYFYCFLLGIGNGYWALFTTMTSEQFGTDVRGTFTTFIPNLVRAMAIPITLSFAFLKPHFGDLPSMQGIGVTIALLALLALALLPETFQRDLDFTEN